MNWPFELPSMPILVRGDGNLTTSEAREWVDACITAALRWAAERCEPWSSDYGSAKMALIERRDRILAVLPERAQ